jgi:hypothetical protein
MSLGDLLDILAILMSFLVALVAPKAKKIEPFSMSPNIFLSCFPMTLNAIHGLKKYKTFLTIVPPMSLMSSDIIFGVLNVPWCPFLPQKKTYLNQPCTLKMFLMCLFMSSLLLVTISPFLVSIFVFLFFPKYLSSFDVF